MATTPYVDPLAGTRTGAESSLSTWAGPYVTDMLGKGKALSELPFTAYGGPLTAGSSNLQDTAFSGLSGLTMPTMGAYDPRSFTTPGVSSSYMSPYIAGALNPQMAEARRQAEITRVNNAGRMTRAGAYGGGRQAVMDSQGYDSLERNLAQIYGTGMQSAFESGRSQFNTEEDRSMRAQNEANQFGLQGIAAQLGAGGVQRGIESEGIAADYDQFKEERDYPYKQVQYQQSLLQGLPLETQNYSYNEPSGLTQLLGTLGGIGGVIGEDSWNSIMQRLFGGTPAPAGSGGAPVITQAEYDQFMGR